MKKIFTSFLLCVFLLNTVALPAEARRSSGGSSRPSGGSSYSKPSGSSYTPSVNKPNTPSYSGSGSTSKPNTSTNSDGITTKPKADIPETKPSSTNGTTNTSTDKSKTDNATQQTTNKNPGASTGYNQQKIKDSIKEDANGNKTYTSSTGKQYRYNNGQQMRFMPGMNIGDFMFMYMIFSAFDNDHDRMEESNDEYILYYTDPMTGDEFQYGENYKLGEALAQAHESDKVCIDCELPVAPEDNFCPKCGGLAFDQTLTSVLYCDSCDMVYRGFNTCPTDKGELIPVSQVATTSTSGDSITETKEEESGPNLFLMIFGGMALLVVGIAGFNFMKQKR